MSPFCSCSQALAASQQRAPLQPNRIPHQVARHSHPSLAPGARRHLSCQRGAPPVGCRAASTLGPAEQGGAAWGAWLQRLPEWASSTLARQHVSDSDASALSSAVKRAAVSYVPKAPAAAPSLEDLGEVPANLHARLALCARVTLLGYLAAAGVVGDVAGVKPGAVEATTTDIAAALEAAGVVVEKRGKRTAYVSLVVTETERQMTWSRLEGLRFHWAVSRAPPPGQKWELPPRGWVTAPDTSVDAGGAWQSVFEKHPLPQPGGTSGPEPLYSLVVGIPLEGPTAAGGLVFVLRSGSTGQNTKWLKDAKTQADFWLDLQKFPLVKA